MPRAAAVSLLLLTACASGGNPVPPTASPAARATETPPAPAVSAPGGLGGRCRFEKIKGNPAAGHGELYECNLFLSPSQSPPAGWVRRTGAPPGLPPRHDGFYAIDGLAPGRYSILLDQPLFWVRPKVVPEVVVQPGRTFELHVELPLDYSTTFRLDQQWTGPDTAWFQSFTATGTSINGIAHVLAGCGAQSADVTVLEDNGEADVRRWRELGARRIGKVKPTTDLWVRWRSGEIATTPGRRYAFRIAGVGGDGKLQPYKRNKDAQSYGGGQAFNAAGEPQGFDLSAEVLSDNDGTRVTVCKRNPGLGDLRSGYFSTKWGQTFTAAGVGLAAVDVWAAGAQNRWDIAFVWRVREGGPEGRVLGPEKRLPALYQAAGAGLHGVSWGPGDVPLSPGATYFVEFEAADPPAESPGFNPFITDDPYDGGHAWQWKDGAWLSRPGDDVSMTVVEYAGGAK